LVVTIGRAHWAIASVVVAVAAALAVYAQLRPAAGPALYRARIVAVYPHDPDAFTQGLTVYDGVLYESTGQYGHSSLREVDLESGQVLKSATLNFTYFGEGMAAVDDRIYQLTWKSQTGFIYDRESFEQLGNWRYRGEGWGLTYDGTHLVVSDGSAMLSFYEPGAGTPVRTIEVRDQGVPIERLNELEYVNGEIWANIWYEDRIARISPESGEVLAWVDLSDLVPGNRRNPDAVLNGIAYDAAADRLFVTGKNWPRLFEIELAEP
jgi:glutamine cyclotransferase